MCILLSFSQCLNVSSCHVLLFFSSSANWISPSRLSLFHMILELFWCEACEVTVFVSKKLWWKRVPKSLPWDPGLWRKSLRWYFSTHRSSKKVYLKLISVRHFAKHDDCRRTSGIPWSLLGFLMLHLHLSTVRRFQDSSPASFFYCVNQLIFVKEIAKL